MQQINIPMRYTTAIGVSDTWLDNWNNLLYDIQGWNIIEKRRSEKKGGV